MYKLFGAACVFTGFILAMAAIEKQHADFYSFLRWDVFLVSILGVYIANIEKDKSKTAQNIFICIGVLFNPLVPVRMSRDSWQSIDLLLAFLSFVIGGVMLFSKNNNKNNGL